MKKTLWILIVSASMCSQAFAEDAKVVKIEKNYEAIRFERMTECVSDNKIYSVGMEIEKDGKRFVCNKFKYDSDFALSSGSPASWRVKTYRN